MPLRLSVPDQHALVCRLSAAGCVFAHEEAQLLIDAARDRADLERLAAQRVLGAPLEHVLGYAEFHGLRIAVEPGVFVPRRRSEFLVKEATARASAGDVVIDLCCGTGAIGVAIIASVDHVELYATDIDPAAVRCAHRNLGARGSVYEGDLFDPLPTSLRGRVDVLVANAPYVPSPAMSLLPAEARLHEPGLALDGGGDGLAVQRRIAAEAPRWLAPGGHLLVETSRVQASATRLLLAEHGLVSMVTEFDALDATVAIGTSPTS